MTVKQAVNTISSRPIAAGSGVRVMPREHRHAITSGQLLLQAVYFRLIDVAAILPAIGGVSLDAEPLGAMRDKSPHPPESWGPHHAQSAAQAAPVPDLKAGGEAASGLPDWDYKTILDAAPGFVLILEPDATIAYINRVLPELTFESVVGSSAYGYMPREYAGQLEAGVARVLQTGESCRFQAKSAGPNGLLAWYEMHLGPLVREGRITNVLVTASDITQRKQAQQQLAHNEEKYRALTTAIPDLLFRISRTGEYLDYFPARDLDPLMPSDRFLGRSVADVLPEPAATYSMNAIRRALRSGVVEEFEYDLLTDSGPRQFEARIVPDEADSVLAIVRDVTARKTAETELETHREHLQRLHAQVILTEERERRKLARGLHDQVGQLLALARGRLASLPKNDANAKVIREVRQLIVAAIKETRTLTFELSSPVLYELGLAAAIESLSEQMPGLKKLSFEFCGDGRAVSGAGDVEIVLFRVTRELLMNVVKHARARRVQVSVRSNHDSYEIVIQDDGVGFKTEYAHQGFTRKGTFGLFAAKEQLDQIGAELRIESSPGGGTCATIVAPRRDKLQSS